MRAAAGLALYGLWFALAFGVRSWTQWRHTGSTGFRGISGRPGSVEWLAGVGLVVALLAGLAASVLDLAGVVDPIDVLAARWIGLAGAAFAGVGIVATSAAQWSMGDAWRIGVDPDERTDLVTSGVFRWARNPIFSAMTVTAIGLTLIVPSVVAVAALVVLVVSLEVQVRVVEEPYLVSIHGHRYVDYSARTGRFVPGIGRLGGSKRRCVLCALGWSRPRTDAARTPRRSG